MDVTDQYTRNSRRSRPQVHVTRLLSIQNASDIMETRKTSVIKTVLILLLAAFFTSLAASQGATLQLENISVHDVTDASGEDRLTGGQFIQSGTNTTFLLNQTEDRKDYRFTFRLNNTGENDWNISQEDELRHEGLDTGWAINRTWYNVSGTEYTGGSFSSGTLSWDTSSGPNMTSQDYLYAKYIVEVDLPASQSYDQRFLANDTTNTDAAEDQHILDLNRLGSLSIVLQEPPNGTVLTQNKTFQVNATIDCTGGECGEVTATARYNETSEADTLIPESSGEPFHTVGSNSQGCGELLSGDSCETIWDVNATGADGSYHLLDANLTSSYDEIAGGQTADTDVQIKQVVMLNLSWSTTDFGLLDPGARQEPAAGNDELKYNISVLENSNDADIWIKGSDLQSQDSDYVIGIENMNRSLENLQSSSEPIQKSYKLLKFSVSAGSVLNTFYWLDVPTGIYKGDYNGSISFKANLTG